jgi:hypothetical protein
MLIGIVAALIVLIVPLCGGSYAELAKLRLRGTWLVTLALAVQIVIISLVDIESETLTRWLHSLTYLMLGVCLAMNLRVRYLWVVALGWLSNAAVIVANAGVMPTSPAAARRIGRDTSLVFENSAVNADARLGFLGDVFATPKDMPLANVFSIGDVILLVGLAMVVYAASRRPSPAKPVVTTSPA